MNKNNIDMRISVLRILATLAVVYLHTCCTVLNPDIFDYSRNQEIYLRIGHQIFFWAVPVFFMISGALLLGSDKELTYNIALKKYILRIFLALTIFSIPFATIKTFMETNTISVSKILRAYIGNDSFEHLWYLYTLIGIYFILPVLKPAIKKIDDKTILIFLIFLYIFDFVLPTISNVIDLKIAFNIPVTYPIFFLVSGYYINNTSKKYIFKGKWNIAIILASIISIILLIFTNHYRIISDSYISPLIAVYSLAIFSAFMEKIPLFSEKTTNFIWKIDRLCFGVYLIHPVPIQFAYRLLKITPCSFELYPLMTILFFIIFTLASFAASFIMNLIPPLRKYVL